MERGSAIIWIFLMIVLFAALTYAVSQNSRSSNSALSEKQAELATTEILNYARTVKNAIHRLQIDGCDDTEISFENNTVSGYTNANAPSDNSCHVFHSNGGGIRYVPDNSFQASDSINFVGASDLLGIGNNCGDSSCSDLYMRFRLNGNEGYTICSQINKALGNNSIWPAPTTSHMLGAPKFQGTYSYHDANNVLFDGKSAACFKYAVDPTYSLFYYTLIAR
ncbi:MAG: hypothetical protein MRY79_06790 [Alphaproteobacteria bacterium]|nr:hypothetical protein [Alphaproteobacteria bacterium]